MGRVASLAGLIELCCTRRAQMNNATNNAFLVHDNSFWDTGGTSKLVARARARRQAATSTRGRDRQALKMQLRVHKRPRSTPIRRLSIGLRAQGWLLRWRSEASRVQNQRQRESLVAAGSSTQLRRCPNRPIRDREASRRRRGNALPRDGRTKRQPPPQEAAPKTAQQKWPPAAPRTRRPIRNPSFLIPGPCPRRPLR